MDLFNLMKSNINVILVLFLLVAGNCYGQDNKNDRDTNNYIAQGKSYLQRDGPSI